MGGIKVVGLNLNLTLTYGPNITIKKIRHLFDTELIIEWSNLGTRYKGSISVNGGKKINLLEYRGEISIKTGDILAHYTEAGNWSGEIKRIVGKEEGKKEIGIKIENANWEGTYSGLVIGISGLGVWDVDGSSAIVETSLYHKPIPWKIYQMANVALDFVDYHKNPFYQHPDEQEEALGRILGLLMEIKKEREDLYQAKNILENI